MMYYLAIFGAERINFLCVAGRGYYQEWGKVFPQSNLINHKKITFYNRYGIMLAADMYIPQNTFGKLPAIAISGPFGAVKEQSSGLYAQKMAVMPLQTVSFMKK